MAQELEIMLPVREASGSNFGLGTICNERNCSVFFQSTPFPPSRQMTGQRLKLGHDRFVPHPSQSIICQTAYN
jgi:hypothetical protein